MITLDADRPTALPFAHRTTQAGEPREEHDPMPAHAPRPQRTSSTKRDKAIEVIGSIAFAVFFVTAFTGWLSS